MTKLPLIAAGLLALGSAAFAEGDIEKGEKTFKKCKACHMVVNGDDVIYKGGKTGPNLYGIIGRTAGTYEGFKYGKGLSEAAEAEFVWTEEALTEYVKDPKKWLDANGFSKKSKMSFKLKKGGEDVAAWLTSVGPAVEESEAPEAGAEAETTEETKESE